MQELLEKVKKILPDVTYQAGDAFLWSPKTRTIMYKLSPDEHHTWTLLHETAHAILGHQSYKSDVELLMLEVAAWQKAKELSLELGIELDDEHIQDCLDTYRDWLHQRSTCPRCSTVSLQVSSAEYRCHNCAADWLVSPSRFCRPYRLSSKQIKKSPGVVPQATFR